MELSQASLSMDHVRLSNCYSDCQTRLRRKSSKSIPQDGCKFLRFIGFLELILELKTHVRNFQRQDGLISIYLCREILKTAETGSRTLSLVSEKVPKKTEF